MEYFDQVAVTKIIENFENPDIPEIKNDPAWSDEDWTRTRKLAKKEMKKLTKNSVNLAMFGWILFTKI